MDGKIEHTKELTTKEVCNIVACSYFHSQGDGGAQSLMLIYIADRMFEDGNSSPPFEEIHLRDFTFRDGTTTKLQGASRSTY